jgi:hypothetical protein
MFRFPSPSRLTVQHHPFRNHLVENRVYDLVLVHAGCRYLFPHDPARGFVLEVLAVVNLRGSNNRALHRRFPHVEPWFL